MDTAILSNYGIDYQKGLSRCLNDGEFYQKLLEMFLEDDSFQRAEKAFEKKDYKALFDSTHELKGACGNADLTALYEAVCPLVELLRHQSGTDEEIAEKFQRMEAAYASTREGVIKAING